MIVIFSGSREGMTAKQRNTLQGRMLEIAEPFGLENIQEAHHGVSGESDKIFHYTARALNFWIVGHPLSETHLQQYRFDCICDEMRHMRPALDRNMDMVGEAVMHTEPALLLATPKKDKVYRSGTYSTILNAFTAELDVEIIQRDGKIRREI